MQDGFKGQGRLGGTGGPATQVLEISGPSILDVTTIADGQGLKRVGNNIVGATFVGSDEKAGVSSSDTTPGYLGTKLVTTAGHVALTVVNPSANETLRITLPSVGPGAVTTGSSGIASITTDAQGRVTAVATATYLTSAAPVDAQYLTLATDSTLTVERVLTPSSGLTGTDGGAGSTYTLTNNLITGIAGGQTIVGGTLTTENLILRANAIDAVYLRLGKVNSGPGMGLVTDPTTPINLGGGGLAFTISAGVTGDVAARLELQGNRTSNATSNLIDFWQGATNRVVRMSSIRAGADNAADFAFAVANAGTLTQTLYIVSVGTVIYGQALSADQTGGAYTGYGKLQAFGSTATGAFVGGRTTSTSTTDNVLATYAGYNTTNRVAMMEFRIANSSATTGQIVFSTMNAGVGAVAIRITQAGHLDLSTGGRNLILDTTTGTQLGTAASQKLALWGSTPVVQPSTTGEQTGFGANPSLNTVCNESTFTGNVGTKAYTLNDIVKHLKNLGAVAAS